MTKLEQLAEHMSRITTRFCKTRVPTGETGKYPVAPSSSSLASFEETESDMEECTRSFTQKRDTSAA